VFLAVLDLLIVLFMSYPILNNGDYNMSLMHLIGFPLAFAMVYLIVNYKGSSVAFDFNSKHINILPLVLLVTMVALLLIYYPVNFLFLSKGDLKSTIDLTPFSLDNITEGLIFAPVFEELVFRGIILAGLLKRYSVKKAIIVSAILFAIPHFNPVNFVKVPFIFIESLFWGWLFYKTKSLVFTIALHFAHNFSELCMNYYFRTVNRLVFYETSIEYLYGDYTVLILIGLGVLFIASIFGVFYYFKRQKLKVAPRLVV